MNGDIYRRIEIKGEYEMKKLMLILPLAALSTVGLMACSKSSDSAPPAFLDMPASQPLTDAQMKDFSATLGDLKNAPDTSLVLNEEDETTDKKKEKELKIKNMDSQSKAVITKIKSDCSIQQPRKETSGGISSVPGSKTTQKTSSKISGSSCPMEYSSVSEMTTTLVSMDMNNKTAAFAIAMNASMSTEIKDAELARKMGSKGSSVTIQISGPMNVQDKKTQADIAISGSGKINTVKYGDLPLTFKARVATSGDSGQSSAGSMKMAGYFIIQMPTYQVVLTGNLEASGGSSQPKYELALNGKPLSPEDLQSMFGGQSNMLPQVGVGSKASLELANAIIEALPSADAK